MAADQRTGDAAEGGGGRGEVSGRVVKQVVEGIPDPAEAKARATLAENGIEDPDPDGWYPRDAWVRTVEAIGERIGDATVRQIGQAVVSNVEWPDGAESFRDGVEVVDAAYHENLRGVSGGGYEWEPGDDGGTLVHCLTPHPAAFDEAVVRATARAFPGDGVSRVEDVSDEHDGGAGDVFEVSWWSMTA